jgi:hypothetical protein
MEPLLWGWSTLFRVSSALVIAAYFIARSRSLQRAEAHAWAIAWSANLAAMAITLVFWQFPSMSATVFAVASAFYFFAKTQFVVLLVAGATSFALEQPRPVPHGRYSAAIAAFSTLFGLVVGSLDRVGMLQSVTMGAILIAGAMVVSRKKTPGWQWLATGFVLRMLLAAAETDGYAIHAAGRTLEPGWFADFLAFHSVFDAGAEWVIALGCAIMLRRNIAGKPLLP